MIKLLLVLIGTCFLLLANTNLSLLLFNNYIYFLFKSKLIPYIINDIRTQPRTHFNEKLYEFH
jgi:hypothetical protein